MNNLQKACAILIFLTVSSFGISAQEDKKDLPGKDHPPPRVKVVPKDDDKLPSNNRDNDNKNRDRDKGNKKPSF